MDSEQDFGTCCGCGGRELVRNVMLLDRVAPISGTGWGCVVCGLPSDGAIAVMCDGCAAGNIPPKFVVLGYVKDHERLAIGILTDKKFAHNLAKHEEFEEVDGNTIAERRE